MIWVNGPFFCKVSSNSNKSTSLVSFFWTEINMEKIQFYTRIWGVKWAVSWLIRWKCICQKTWWAKLVFALIGSEFRNSFFDNFLWILFYVFQMISMFFLWEPLMDAIFLKQSVLPKLNLSIIYHFGKSTDKNYRKQVCIPCCF